MPVERPRRQRSQPFERHTQLAPGQPVGGIHIVDTMQPDYGSFPMKPDGRDQHRLDDAGVIDEQLGARSKSLLRKIGLGVDDHLAANPVRPSDAPDERHLFPVP